jgi:hypothetical protein
VEIKANEKQPLSVVLTELPKPSVPVRPTIAFNATSTSIQSGESAQLSWQTQNADEVSLEPGGSVGKSGSTTVKPATTTTYTLTAKGEGGLEKRSVTIGVVAPTPPAAAKVSIEQFDAGPDSIQADQTSKLFWATQNATDVSIDQGVGSGLGASGSRQVKPSQTTTYILTARGPGGDIQKKNVTVTVTERVVTPTPLPAGTSAESKCVDRFKEAYESMSVDVITRVWPTASDSKIKNRLKDGFKGAQAIKLDEQCSELPPQSPDTARYQCRETMTYTREGKRQPPQPPSTIEFVCKNTPNGWVVQGRAVK